MIANLLPTTTPLVSEYFSFLMVTGIFAGLAAWWHKHNCHEHGCLRLQWHPDENGHPICKVHHGDHPAKGWFRYDKTHPRHRKAKALARKQSS